MNTASSSARLRILVLSGLFAVGLFLSLFQPAPAFALDDGGVAEEASSMEQLQSLGVVADTTEANSEEEPVLGEEQVLAGGLGENGSNVRVYDDGRGQYQGNGQDGGQDNNQGQQDQGLNQDQQVLADGIYRIASSASTAMTADIANGSVDAGANLRTWTWNTTEAQCFQLVYDAATASFAILSAKSGLAITASSDTKGANLY